MEKLKQILIDHARRYPLMEPTDAVKLLYQNEFGGGHLIRDVGSCLAYLRREYESIAQEKNGQFTEEIGNGLVRVYLSTLDAQCLTPEQLGDAFIRSAALHNGSLDSFLSKLELLRQLTRDGYFSFAADELDAYLARYKQAEYPMVSHSNVYRAAYSPAYRIVLKSVLDAE